jgi:hypothetical protein
MLDYLMVLPWLSEDAVVCFHDTNLHTRNVIKRVGVPLYTTNMLMSAVPGKILTGAPLSSAEGFPNIGAIETDGLKYVSLFTVFNLLTIPWSYVPGADDWRVFADFCAAQYGPEWVAWLQKVYAWQAQEAPRPLLLNHKLAKRLERVFKSVR